MRKSIKGIFVLVGAITLTVGSNLQAKADWKQDDGKWWYAVNSEKGYVTDWGYIAGKWYYFDENGYMKTDWIEKDGKWYYLKNSGEMVTGWYNINGDDWYYFDADGVMKTTDLVQDDVTYHFSASGKCINPYETKKTTNNSTTSNNSSNWNSGITKESVVYYHDAAERNTINRFTTADIIIEPSTDDSEKEAQDLDGMTYYPTK